jgi:hypothetical protein
MLPDGGKRNLLSRACQIAEWRTARTNELLGSGTRAGMRSLPGAIEFWHVGHSDQAGFEILRVLRQKSGRAIQPLQMTLGRIPFEQDSISWPTESPWPFHG